MTAELVIAPEAAQDLDEACIQAICRLPEMHARVHKEYRRALVRRFPYVVLYEYAAGTVIVYCVFHASRDPQKWRERLP
jgi:plasmid stabilization system protein ParE